MIWYLEFEKEFILWLQGLFAGSFLQKLLYWFNYGISLLGTEVVAIAIIGMIYWGINKEKGRNIGLAVIFVSATNTMIKDIFKRLRPYQSVEQIKLLQDVGGYSFPSGHSCDASSLTYSLALNYPKKFFRKLAIVLPILIALSRNYLGCHWLSDVIVGLLFGYLIAFINDKLIKRYPDKQKMISIIYLMISAIGLLYCEADDYFTSFGILIGFVLAMYYDEKKVNFTNTDKWYLVITRTIGGLLVYFILSPILKRVFALVATDNVFVLGSLRMLRYAIVVFVMLAIYPMLFKYEDKLLKKKNKIIE